MKTTTPAKIQKNINIVSDTNSIYTVMQEGEPKTIIIPYFEGAEEYLEDLEMYASKQRLQKKFQASVDSGVSDFSI